jgi:hypothetical protein
LLIKLGLVFQIKSDKVKQAETGVKNMVYLLIWFVIGFASFFLGLVVDKYVLKEESYFADGAEIGSMILLCTVLGPLTTIIMMVINGKVMLERCDSLEWMGFYKNSSGNYVFGKPFEQTNKERDN